jgi:A/G-specific adenine glycosylase
MARKTPATAAALEIPTAAWKRALVRRVTAWYRRHQRDLPWRFDRDPYRIWVSEIMLQQTQVATVVPYFTRFVAAFPSVGALAGADERDVLRLWEGLGYYRRARQMHRAAHMIVAEFGGRFPREIDEVRRLPGIGRYTAGAIVSMAFDRPAPILEANTVRLLSRLAAFTGDVSRGAARKALWGLAEAIVPARNCGQFNQALMELGSLLCTPKRPACPACPLGALCAARRLARQEQIPGPAARPRVEAVREAAVVAWHRGKVFVRQRAPGERWAGLWDFLRFPLIASAPRASRQELVRKVRQQAGLSIRDPEKIATLKHGVTRFRITLDCYQAKCRAGATTLAAGQWQWIEPAELAQLPLSVTGRKLSRLLGG